MGQRTRFSEQAAPHLTVAEIHILDHREHILLAEIEWHEQLLAALPQIVADERSRLPNSPTTTGRDTP